LETLHSEKKGTQLFVSFNRNNNASLRKFLIPAFRLYGCRKSIQSKTQLIVDKIIGKTWEQANTIACILYKLKKLLPKRLKPPPLKVKSFNFGTD